MRPSDRPKRIFICSRYAGDIKHNTETARKLCRMVVESGQVPFAPHLLFTQFLDEQDPVERERGTAVGLAFMEACDEVWAYVEEGISEGMRREIEHARRIGKPVVGVGSC